MSAFNDASCPKCSKRFGWRGQLTDRPACPGCGHRIPQEQLEAEQLELDRVEQQMLAEMIRDRESGAGDRQRLVDAADPERLKRRLEGARQARELMGSGLLELGNPDTINGFLGALINGLRPK